MASLSEDKKSKQNFVSSFKIVSGSLLLTNGGKVSGAGFGIFMWFVLGGGAQVCADSRAHIPVKLRSASGIIAQWLSTLVFESWSFC